MGKSREALNKYITNDNLPEALGGTFNGNSAWDFVLNTSTNALSLMSQEEEEDDDSKWMKEKTMTFEKGKNKKNKRMSKIMDFGKNKLSSAKTKIKESKSKIQQKREERKVKKQQRKK